MRTPNRNADAVTLRFLKVVERLREEFHIPISHIERELGVPRTYIHRQLANPERTLLRPYWLENICKVYNVRPVWLMLGVDDMFYSSVPLYLSKLNKAATAAHTSLTAE